MKLFTIKLAFLPQIRKQPVYMLQVITTGEALTFVTSTVAQPAADTFTC